MAQNPLISVVLPTYNRAPTLLRSIKSVLNQTYQNLELIIVDDASEDSTPNLVNGITDPRLIYIKHSAQQGAGTARNSGIEISKGEYIAFQDSDDEWSKDKLEEQLKLFNTNKNIGAVFSPYLKVSERNKEQVPAKLSAKMWGDIHRNILFCSWIGTPTLMVKIDLIKSIGGFDQGLEALEDWELIIRLAKLCRFGCINKPLVTAYLSEGSITEREEINLTAIEQIIEKHHCSYNSQPAAKATQLIFIGNRKCLNGNMKEGINYFKKAIKVSPGSIPAWIGLILAYTGQNMYRRIIMFKRQLAH
ncbi:glycosyltransferase [Thermodesulfobacteriota bacterium]